MSSEPVFPASATADQPARPVLVVSDSPRRRWARLLEQLIFFFCLLFALVLPHSVKGTHHAYEAAVVAWAVKLALDRRRPYPIPLAAPILTFLVLSAISTALSPVPLYSWDRMKIVGLIFVAIVFAENLRSVRQLRWIVALLLFSAAVSAGITVWQYLGGYGVQMLWFPPDSPLAMTGVQPGDVVQKLDGHGMHSTQALREAIAKLPAGTPVRMQVAHSTPIQRLEVTVTRASLVGAGLLLPERLARGRPSRPQGFFSHYEIYGEVMMQCGLLAFGVLVASRARRGRARWLTGAVFLVMLAVVIATQTRSVIAAILFGCFIIMMIALGRKERVAGLALLVAVLAFSTYWIHHTRGFHWVDKRDPGTDFRVMMWEDGLRLIPKHPWFGVGMHSVLKYWREYDIRAYRIFPVRWHFHSDYIQLAVERGLPALAAFLWLAAAYVLFLFRLLPRARRAGWFSYGLVLGVLGGWLAFLASGVVQYNLGEEQIDVTIWCFMGLTLALDRIIETAGDREIG